MLKREFFRVFLTKTEMFYVRLYISLDIVKERNNCRIWNYPSLPQFKTTIATKSENWESSRIPNKLSRTWFVAKTKVTTFTGISCYSANLTPSGALGHQQYRMDFGM